MKQFVFLSGLPRTGSTLLSAILSQNPSIHAEGFSAVCQLMWDMNNSLNGYSKQPILANKRNKTPYELMSAIPKIYYNNITKPIILDKSRTWTLPGNLNLIKQYINPAPKIIVLVRPIDQIVRSFANLIVQNNLDVNLQLEMQKMVEDYSDPIMRACMGVINAKNNNSGEFIFVSYNDLVYNTKESLHKIYDFCGWDLYEHDLNNIINNHPEDDLIYGLIGQHDVRPKIGKAHYDVELPKDVLDKCLLLNDLILK
jgi:sulfotransferase